MSGSAQVQDQLAQPSNQTAQETKSDESKAKSEGNETKYSETAKARTFTQDEVNKIQSAKDTEIKKWKAQAQKVTELQSIVDALKAEIDVPYQTDDQKVVAESLRNARIELVKAKSDKVSIESELERYRKKEAKESLKGIAESLAEKHGFSLDELLKCDTEDEMYKAIALGDVPKAGEKLPPVNMPKQAVIQGDEAFLLDYSRGKNNDHKRAKEILGRKKMGG